MKNLLFCRLALSTFLTLLTSQAQSAEAMVRYEAKPGSKVRIAGTSTLHDWTMDGQIIAGHLEVDPAIQFDQSKEMLTGASGGKVNARAQVNIPVRSLKSGMTSMDSVMQEAMKQKNHAQIQFRLTEMSVKEGHKVGTPFLLDTKGELTVAGVTNKISMPVSIERVNEKRLKIMGTHALKMTSYGVTPPAPALALGAIKTGNDIKITLEWVVEQRLDTPKAADK